MRKYKKKLLVDLLHTMCEAHEVIKEYFVKQKYQEVKILLGDCQEAAYQIAKTIEESEGPESITVQYIDEYCHLLFEIHENLICYKKAGELKRCLNQSLEVIKRSIEEDIGIHYEIVFIPYKASMWDSMETVFWAAYKDKDCKVYCVPIPYYDKNFDGSIGEMHYEAESLKKQVPITNWKTYNVQERYPDIIFVQNPYDNNNLVTTVHPAFYTSVLRQHTGCLAYLEYGIPLWIYKKPVPYENLIPGWFNFDLFFTYSKEYARNQEYAMKVINPHMTTQVISMGSPKFDKVLCSRKEQFKLPDKWKQIIGNKKVVLMNTSLGSLLNHTEEYIERLKNTLKIFKENKQVVLWWRPHPLSTATMSSMRKGLLKSYLDLVKAYKEESWGIYDDSIELHRSIAYSDAYYGDESSLVYLYCATGKPFSICGKPHQCYYFTENQEDFSFTLDWRMNHMKGGKGGNTEGYNNCVSWYLFYEDLNHAKFLKLFLHYVVNKKDYKQAEEYERLQIRLFTDFVLNTDGTAGQKIFDYCKENVLSCKNTAENS